MTGELLRFIWGRLPLNEFTDTTNPCLAEDWFVSDKKGAELTFVFRGLSEEESLRRLYRYARKANIEGVFKDGKYCQKPELLLYHQFVQLLPALIAQTQRIRNNFLQ